MPGRRIAWLVCVVSLAAPAVAVGPGVVVAAAATAGRCASSPSSSSSSSSLVVETDKGAVRGTTEPVPAGAKSVDVRAWKHIPYAAPPVGDLRWRAPEPAKCWRGTRDATAFGPKCPQLDGGVVVGAEDCLSVNVWRPGATVKSPRAVMVFLHGGGNVQGSASESQAGVSLYDGAELAARGDVIVVTLQYRIGALGWLADDSLARNGPPGNYGLLDQIAALQWVQRNIAAFGGDAERVTIFGESAGAVDTCLLLASPQAKGLFARALMESGACVASDATFARSSATAFAGATGCTDAATAAACLRALPADKVVETLPGTIDLQTLGRPRYGPYVDGHVLPAPPLDLIRSGMGSHVPVIVGSNSEETRLFLRSLPATPEAYAAAVTSLVGPTLGARVLAAYPADQYASPGAALVAATTDPRFTCTAATTVQALVAGQSEPVYRYFFTHTMDGGALRARGAFHGLELFFVFGHLGSTAYQPTASESALSDTMIAYWSQFAKTGDPNHPPQVTWPRAAAGSDPYLGLDVQVTAGDGLRTAQCDFWASLAR